MSRPHILTFLVFAGCFCVLFLNLGACQLWDRDEPRNAGCAAEMMERGDFVVPIFNDELRHQKPVLLYWLMIVSYWIFGVNEFAARFPSAMLAMGTLFAAYGIAHRLFGRLTSILSTIILVTSLMFVVAARAATPDSLLTFTSTLTIWIYVACVFAPFNEKACLKNPDVLFPKKWWCSAAIYGVMGLGVLAKGPVGFIVPTATIGLFCLIYGGRQRSGLFHAFHPLHFAKTAWMMKPFLAAAVVLLIAGPWYMLVHLRTDGDFTEQFFVGEHFGRATTAFENHRGGLWYYPVAILIGFFPWSVFWWPVVLNLKNQWATRWSPGSILLLGWVAIQVGLFSIAQTKLPSYVTPCYGALAILTANCLCNWLANTETAVSDIWMKVAMLGLTIGGVFMTIGFGYMSYEFLPNEAWLTGIGFIPVVGGLLSFRLINENRRGIYALAITVMVAFVTCILIFGLGTTSLAKLQTSRQLLEPIRNSPANVRLASYGLLESSWVFYGERPVNELLTDVPSQTFASIPSLQRATFWSPKRRLTPEQFAAGCPESMVITSSEYLEDIKKRLPNDFKVIQTAEYFFQGQRLYLLGRPQSTSGKLVRYDSGKELLDD